MKRNDHHLPNSVRRSATLEAAHPPPDAGRGAVAVAACEKPQHDSVTIGSVVEIRDLRTGELEEYTLTPPDQADILRNRVSSLAPIGQALYGRRAGETIEVAGPAGAVRVRIENVCCPCHTRI